MTALAIPVRPGLPAYHEIDVVEAWMAGMKANTLRAYRKDLEDFASFLRAPGASQAIRDLLSMSRGEANATALYYRAALTERELAPSTIARRLAALRSVVRCARILGRVDWEVEVESPRAEAFRDTRGPGTEGWEKMLRNVRKKADEGDEQSVRDLAIVTLLHDLGLRRGELCALDLEAVDQERGTVAVVGKGHRQAREHTLTDRAIDALADWLAVRGTAPGPLFHRLDNGGAGTGRLTGEAVRLVVRGMGLGAGIARPVRPHGLRHQAITAVLEKTDGNVLAAMKFARHSNPRTTMIYDDNRTDVAGQMARLIAGEG